MKIFDCFMYFDEEMILDLRFNVLDKYVDYFVIVESTFTHKGDKRKLQFNFKKFEKFKNKIIYLTYNEYPKNIEEIFSDDDEGEKSRKFIFNAAYRENGQRNFIINGLEKANDEDIILISDVDEIPNLDSINLHTIKSKIIIFKQTIFYYKFNRFLPNFTWYGTKSCKKKYLKNPQWLRNIKNKKFSAFRLDTLFSITKYINKSFVENGGWHFSNIKNANDIQLKLKSYLHHRDYEVEELGQDKINELILNNATIYDMFGDKTSKKYGDDKRKKLEKYKFENLPEYIKENKVKLTEWID